MSGGGSSAAGGGWACGYAERVVAGPGEVMTGLVSVGDGVEVATAEAGSWLGREPPAKTTMAAPPTTAKRAPTTTRR